MDPSERNKTDEQLVRLVQEGNTEVFEQLVLRYQDKISRYGRKFLQHTQNIEDVVQEVFLKTYRNIRSFNPDKKFSSWIYRIAHNEFINVLRKDHHGFFVFLDPDMLALNPSSESPLTDFEKQEVAGLLKNSLQNLDEKYREVLLLYFEENFSYQEIADILRIPIATVGVRINRGKKYLTELIKKNGIDKQ